MKLFLALLGTFLLASATPVISAAAPRHGSYESSPFGQEMKVQRDLDRRSSCSTDSLVCALQSPTQSAAASSFCSSFLQPTVTTVVTSDIYKTKVLATTATTTTTTYVLEARTVETIVLCATPSPKQTCNYHSNEATANLIQEEFAPYGITSFTCQQRCLANPDCKSFQYSTGVVQYLFCGIFNETVRDAGVVRNGSAPYEFYDRDCPAFQAAGCPKPHAKRNVATPSELEALAPSRISSACSCLITSVPNAVTKTVTTSFLLDTTITETFTATALTTQAEYNKNDVTYTTSYSYVS